MRAVMLAIATVATLGGRRSRRLRTKPDASIARARREWCIQLSISQDTRPDVHGLRRAANPGGLPKEVFDGLQAQLAANRA